MKKNLLKKGLLLTVLTASVVGIGSYGMSYRTMANEGEAPFATVTEDQTVTTKLYYYATMPGSAMDGSENPVYGLGVQVAKATTDPSELYAGTAIVDDVQFTVTGQEKALYPDIEFKGVTYKFAANGSEEANKTGYYTLQLLNRTVEDGAEAGDNNYNTTAEGNTYHINYLIQFNEEVEQASQPEETTKKTSYTVNYIDAVTGEKLAESKTVNDQVVGTTVSETGVKVDGYITPDGNYTMTLQEDASQNVMNLTYKKDAGQVGDATAKQYKYTVKYVDVDTNKEIATATTNTVNVNTVVQAANNRMAIKNYKYVKDTGDLTVTDNEGNNVMTVYYKEDKSVNTGTDTNMALYAGLGATGLLGAALLAVIASKKKLAKR